MSATNVKKVAMIAASAAVALAGLAPVAAMAQGYGPSSQRPYYEPTPQPGNYGYDPCRRAENERAVGGALVGGGIGAVAGSNLAARKVRPEGALLGAGIGALIGSQVGKSTAACDPRYADPYYNSGYDRYAQAPSSYGYAEPYAPPPPPPPAPAYDDRYGRSYDYSYSYDYDSARDGRRGRRDDGCEMVEGRFRMPDGRTQTVLMKACRDSRGEYQLVQ